MQYAWFALIGLVIGALAGQVLRGHYKIVIDMVVGAAGALAGSYLFLRFLAEFAPAKFGGYVFAAIGALLLLLGWRALRSVE